MFRNCRALGGSTLTQWRQSPVSLRYPKWQNNSRLCYLAHPQWIEKISSVGWVWGLFCKMCSIRSRNSFQIHTNPGPPLAWYFLWEYCNSLSLKATISWPDLHDLVYVRNEETLSKVTIWIVCFTLTKKGCHSWAKRRLDERHVQNLDSKWSCKT